MFSGVTAERIAVPAAGGCNACLAIMAHSAAATANGAEAAAGSPAAIVSAPAAAPAPPLSAWPSSTLRGCEKGAPGAPKMRAAEAPKEAKESTPETSGSTMSGHDNAAIPTKAPAADSSGLFGFADGEGGGGKVESARAEGALNRATINRTSSFLGATWKRMRRICRVAL